MDLLGLALAMLLPWITGAVWVRALWRDTAEGVWALVLGYGFLLGMLATTGIMYLQDAMGFRQGFLMTSAILAACALSGACLSRNLPWQGWIQESSARQARGEEIVSVLLLALIVTRIAGLALEIHWRPLYPWDAWRLWAVKAQVWYELGRLAPFVDGATWLARPDGAYTIEGAHYPAPVSLISTWAALGLGRWDGSLVNYPWLLCFLALGLAFYGQLRVWGASPLTGIVFTYLLLSIPLLDTHVALAGYADLWLTAAYGLAGMAFLQWVRTGEARQGTLALVLVLACATIKVEGSLWVLSFLPALLLVWVRVRTALALLGLVLVGLALWWAAGGFSVELPGLGPVVATPELIQAPLLGRLQLRTHIDWWPYIDNFLVLDNWHLLWFLAPVVIAIAAPRLYRDRVLLTGGVLVLSGLAMLFVLFSFTSASAWAADFTAINRLYLHMVPVLLFYVFVVLQDGLRWMGPAAEGSASGFRLP